MFRYKKAKQKSNYLCVKIPMDVSGVVINEDGENIYISPAEYTLVFKLFGGSDIATARYHMGYIGKDLLIGETVVNYAFEDGSIVVSDYDYADKGYYESPNYHERPYFNIYRVSSQEALSSEKPLFTVSSSDSNSPLSKVTDAVKKSLRTIYDYIEEAASNAGFSLQMHITDEVETDEGGNIVGGYMVGVQRRFGGYFYNIEGSSRDRPPVHVPWLTYYAQCVNLTLPDVRFCASEDIGLECGNPVFVGGHILKYSWITSWFNWRLYFGRFIINLTTGMTRFQHMVPRTPGARYYMLPICSRHNNTNHYNVLMHTRFKYYFKNHLLVLTGFIF